MVLINLNQTNRLSFFVMVPHTEDYLLIPSGLGAHDLQEARVTVCGHRLTARGQWLRYVLGGQWLLQRVGNRLGSKTPID